MKIEEKKVLVVGTGISGIAAAKLLLEKKIDTVLFDANKELDIEKVEPKTSEGGTCSGMVFVITGDVHHYKNRDEFKAYVESQGGKVTGSVSKKTTCLVNNDVESTSSKNKKAKELGIPIISEDEFIARYVR